MILLDTHAWIWWVTESPALSSRATRMITRSDELGVSVISCWEVAMLVAKQRIGFQIDVEEWIALALKRPRIRLIPLDPRIAILATRLPGELHSDPVDRLIAATCLTHGISLVSKDLSLAEWGHVSVVW
jgi:PIN domain nuclease of toxin-antitoxin system